MVFLTFGFYVIYKKLLLIIDLYDRHHKNTGYFFSHFFGSIPSCGKEFIKNIFDFTFKNKLMSP